MLVILIDPLSSIILRQEKMNTENVDTFASLYNKLWDNILCEAMNKYFCRSLSRISRRIENVQFIDEKLFGQGRVLSVCTFHKIVIQTK